MANGNQLSLRLAALACIGLLASIVGRSPGIAHSQDVRASQASYTVSFPQAQAHYVNVEMRIEPGKADSFDIFMPVWTPGSYLVREYARHVDSVAAIADDGSQLEILKRNKNTWTIRDLPDGPIKVTYRVYCNEMSVRTNFVDAEFGVLNGAATYLTSESWLSQPVEVRFVLPEGWQQAVSSMKRPPIGGPAHSFMASSYHELVDSPVVLGSPTLHPFEVGGVNHFLVNVGGDGFWDGDRAASDMAKIVAEHQAMWGSVPYERYYFLNVIGESGGGLEHDHCSLLMSSRWDFRIDRSYKRWLGLVSHEFFHTWNVRRLRPAPLVDYDYQTETYFEELWVAEGITSYYDSLALARAGVSTPAEYLADLSKQIYVLQSTPGRLEQSLSESSHDTWIKFYRPNENSSNTSISYYNKGSVVAFLLDMEIRQRTAGAKSLDDVMRELYRQHASGGYTNQDVETIASSVAGADLGDWFERHVDSAEELDYEPALAWLGLQFQSQPAEPKTEPQTAGKTSKGQAASSPESEAASGTPWLGMTTETKDGRLEISRVTEDSPAFVAGLGPGDEVIAINGFRVSGGVSERLKQYSVGDRISLVTARRGKLRTVSVELVAKPEQTWRIIKLRKPSEAQQARLDGWLAGSVTADDGEVETAAQ